MNSLRAFVLGASLILVAAAAVCGAAETPAPAGPERGPGSNRAAVVEMEDIHDIKPLEKSAFDPRWFWLALVLAAAGLLILAFIHRLRRVRRNARPQEAPLPPAHLRALESLARLEDEKDRNGREFYFRLSLIFRCYLEARVGLDALEMTSEELLPAVEPLASEHDLNLKLQTFIAIGDAVKFAARPVSRIQMQLDLEFVRDWVRRTAPDSMAGRDPV